MNPDKLKAAYARLQHLDERLVYKVRSSVRGGLSRPGAEQLDERLRHLAEMTLELKEALAEVIEAFARRPDPPPE